MTEIRTGRFSGAFVDHGGAVFNVKHSEFAGGAAGDGVTDDSAAIQAAVDEAILNGGGTIVFPPGSYYVASSITGNPIKTTFRGEGGSSFGSDVGATGDSRGAVEIITDQAIVIFDFGDDTASRWHGPNLENVSFRDASGAGTALGGVRITRMNQMEWRNVGFADFTAGFAWEFDGGADWVQYVTFIHPRVSNCLYGYRKVAKNSDITFVGGLLQGNNIPGSKGIYEVDAAGGGGRLNIFGTGFNWWDIGIDLDGWRYGHIAATFEQSAAATGTGTAIRIRNTTAGAAFSLDNKLIGCHFDKWGTGVEIGTNVAETNLVACSFVSCTVTIDDSGSGTQWFASGQTGGHLGLKVSQPMVGGGDVSLRTIFRPLAAGGTEQPIMLIPTAKGLLICDDGSIDGGLYLSGDGLTSAMVGGGVYADMAAPRATSTSGTFIKFSGTEISFHAFSGVTPGETIDVAATKQFSFTNGAIWLPDGVGAPSARAGLTGIYVDSADGDLKAVFGDGTVKTITADT